MYLILFLPLLFLLFLVSLHLQFPSGDPFSPSSFSSPPLPPRGRLSLALQLHAERERKKRANCDSGALDSTIQQARWKSYMSFSLRAGTRNVHG